jgi:hypothetical protein
VLCLAVLPLRAEVRPEVTAPFTTVEITVDGQSADWSPVKKLGHGIHFFKGDDHPGQSREHLGTTVCGEMDDDRDCRVDLWLSHDAKCLYLLAEVRDDDHEPFDVANENNPAYREDTLQVYVDSAKSCAEKISSPPCHNQIGYQQFSYSTDGNIRGACTDLNDQGVAPAPKGSEPDGKYWQAACHVAEKESGYLYVFEMAFALVELPEDTNFKAMKPGKTYRFCPEFCDADNGKELQGFIWWSSDGSTDAWTQPALWGDMSLAPEKESDKEQQN